MLIPVLTFVLVLGIVLGAYWIFVARVERATDATLKRRLASGRRVDHVIASVQREEQRLSNVPALQRILSSRESIVRPVERMVEQAGVKTTVGVVLLSAACLGMAGVVLGQVTGGLWLSVLLGVGFFVLPFTYLKWKCARRVQRFEELFPEALDLMSRAMRAGHTFITAIGMVAEELPEPIAAEFKLLHDQQNFGMPVNDALRSFGERVPLLTAKFFVTAILTQRESGGNLTEVLDNLSSVIRDRFMVQRQVKIKSAHGRITGWVLVALPPCLALVLSIVNPNHFGPMFADPFGFQMIIGAVVLQVIGALVIRKIVNIEY